jgi:hypothetical protein
MYPECINIPCFPTLDGESSDMFHSGCLILPRELGEVWLFESWREQFFIVARWIRCPVYAGLLFGFYPILLLQHLQEVVDQLLLNVRFQFSSWSFWRPFF